MQNSATLGNDENMSKIKSTAAAGNIIRRMREELGMSRAALSRETRIAPRTIYALEQGESPNFGLGNYLKLLEALGLSMEISLQGNDASAARAKRTQPKINVPEYELADIWKLD